jgi:ribosome-binding factor A
MPKPSTRPQKIADLIQQELAYLIKREARDPRLAHVSLTAVRLSPDLKLARVYFTMLKTEDRAAIEKAFEKASGFFRSLLAKNMQLRYIPHLYFVYDESIERGEKISSLINSALEADKKMHQKTDDHHDDEE